MTKVANNSQTTGLSLIDPPVGRYSSSKAIEAWISGLEQMEPDESVIDTLQDAKAWLAWAEKRT